MTLNLIESAVLSGVRLNEKIIELHVYPIRDCPVRYNLERKSKTLAIKFNLSCLVNLMSLSWNIVQLDYSSPNTFPISRPPYFL